MKLFIMCHKCINANPEMERVERLARLPAPEDPVFDWTCPEGHKIHICLLKHKFEILFEMGVNAFADGYAREAVTAFAASLERFYEFYIRVIAKKHSIPAGQLEEAWRPMASRSENQLGAYYFAYLIENGRPAPRLPGSWTEFRNDVTHKGLIPSEKKAVQYGQEVLNYIESILVDLRNSSAEQMGELLSERTKEFRPNGELPPPGMQYTMTAPVTIISASQRRACPKLSEYVEQVAAKLGR